ncbi:hypothetical protein CANCADRAFT_1991 [Tortispora caseinolytica NRRL Y-17796]|uniref:General negative regulator of transcription subunit n=1 Tax=Tortispora caseinolytica NRRL Y-17796 TaxID=767744 RepID=A0A1E4TER9_9ASCO|nr:hypothetical protein CANCADRAFT_1991 [Tortispora caseinolytica NRRL Y-17796]
MSARKLQQEIDRVFKRVAEGVAIFDGLYDKVQSCTNPSQKDKLEQDLKREIKKLQRLRDQIKTWQGSNDVKDKKSLADNRKLIETEMERFKAVEREMKTKAYSREGLTASAKADPRDQEKAEMNNWITNIIEDLESQIEQFESEQESIQSTMKKGRKDTAKMERIAELDHFIERHKWHIKKLETVMRMLESDALDISQIQDIQEDITYYVESNQELEFAEDEEIYDELNLEDDEDGLGYTVAERRDDPDKADSLNAIASTTSLSAASAPVSSSSSAPAASNTATTAASAVPSSSSTTSHNTTAVPAVNPKKAEPTPSRGPSGPLSAVAAASPTISKPQPQPHLPHPPQPPSAASAFIAGGSSKPTVPAANPVGETLKYASAAAAAAAAANTSASSSGLVPLPPPASKATSSSGSSGNANKAPGGSMSNGTTPLTAAAVAASSAGLFAGKDSSHVQGESAIERAEANDSNKSSATDSTVGTRTPDLTRADTLSSVDDSFAHLPPGLQDLISSLDSAKKRAENPPPISSISDLLESSLVNCPDSKDAEKPKHYRPQNPYPMASYYPQVPLAVFDDPALYSKLDFETLFYIFYYRQGTYQQYLAAKELKRQNWRYHKGFLTWFQRHDEPDIITDDYEQGTYRYFDFEGMWLQRRKANFQFEYKYLEDSV